MEQDDLDFAQAPYGGGFLQLVSAAAKLESSQEDVDKKDPDYPDRFAVRHMASSIRHLPENRTYESPVASEDEEANYDQTMRASQISGRQDSTTALNYAEHLVQSELRQRSESNASTLDLAAKLQQIFKLVETEEIIGEYPCWLLNTVLVQGYMYVTRHRICFYAYLPQKDTIVKSGYLSKKSRATRRLLRFYAQIKNEVLTYYSHPNDLYFPSGQIDLRYADDAELSDVNEHGKSSHFKLYTQLKTYLFKADSEASASEWVKSIKKVIFCCKNDGDAVKIDIPIANIIDVEQCDALEFASTTRVRAIHDETFAVLDHYFSFFSDNLDAAEVIRKLVEQHVPVSTKAIALSDSPKPMIEQVRNTTFSLHPDQPSKVRKPCDSRRASLDLLRSSIDLSRSSMDSQRSQTVDSTDKGHTQKKHKKKASISSLSSPLRKLGFMGSKKSKLKKEDTGSFGLGALTLSLDEINKAGNDSSLFQDSPEQSTTDSDGSPPGVEKAVPAWNIAEWMRKRSVAIGNNFPGKAYVDRVSGMLTGDAPLREKGLSESPSMLIYSDEDDEDDDPEKEASEERFRAHFAAAPEEKLLQTWNGFVFRTFPLQGKLYLSDARFCFRSTLVGTRTKMIIPLKDIENVHKQKGYAPGFHGLVAVIKSREELFFEFTQSKDRDECASMLLEMIERCENNDLSEQITALKERVEKDRLDHLALERAHKKHHSDVDRPPPENVNQDHPPILFDSPQTSMVNFKPTASLRITCLTIGSRGDVQPFVALCKGLKKEGHQVKIATHEEFREWITDHGIDFAPVAGDPAELMRICVEHGLFTVSFIREATAKFRTWIDDLLTSAWSACQYTDVLIETPSAMAGLHIAEALGIPYFRAFTMPWTRTRTYPHAFAVPDSKKGGNYNAMTYTLFDSLFWRAISGQVNSWRKKTLNIHATNMTKMRTDKIPFIYNFSPSVVPPPIDWHEWVRISGYWFLDNPDSIAGRDWEPPDDLSQFIRKARADKKKLIYIGFGSIVVSDPKAVTKNVVESVMKANVRCILSKGWSDRLDKTAVTEPEVPLPPEILQIRSAPHDWLFQQIDAAVHHGGAGTTGASLRAGIPTIIKPFFGDQYFWGSRIEDLGVGVQVKKLNVNNLTKVLKAVDDPKIIAKAKVIGEKIRSENGIKTAIEMIYRDLEYARNLVRNPHVHSGHEPSDAEESFVYVGDDDGATVSSPRQGATSESEDFDDRDIMQVPSNLNTPEYTSIGQTARNILKTISFPTIPPSLPPFKGPSSH